MRLIMLLISLALFTCGCSQEEKSPTPHTATEPAAKSAETAQAVQQTKEMATQMEEKATQMAGDVQQQTEKMVEEGKEKMAPMVADDTATSSGQAIYSNNCAVCHKLGLMDAPKLGDKAAWAQLLSDGIDPLVTSAINGKGTMPAKGGNSQLSDAEVRAAVEYLVEQSR